MRGCFRLVLRKKSSQLLSRFWDGTAIDTVGKNKKAIAEYIRTQLQQDLAYEQMSMKELVDPFTGEPVKGSKK